MDNEPLLHEDVEPTSERHDGASQRSSRFAQYLPFFAYIFFFKFLAHFTIGLLELPLLRLLERAICQRHFTGLKSFANIYSSSEDTCKDAAIQDELAMVVGFKSSFDSVPCMPIRFTRDQVLTKIYRPLSSFVLRRAGRQKRQEICTGFVRVRASTGTSMDCTYL
jgi:hypothetical protein